MLTLQLLCCISFPFCLPLSLRTFHDQTCSGGIKKLRKKVEISNGRMNSQCIIYWYFYGVEEVPHIFSKLIFLKGRVIVLFLFYHKVICCKLSRKSLTDDGKSVLNFCLVLKPCSHLFCASSESQTGKDRKRQESCFRIHLIFVCSLELPNISTESSAACI